MTETIQAHQGTDSAVMASKGDKKSLGASVVGQLLEWYEWSSYAVFAPFIAAAMFSKSNPASALLATFGVFAIGFLARPLGGIVFGIIADKKGRKNVLMTTILLMAVSAVIIGILPGYETIGVWSSVGLLLIRVIQGFAHGGESAAANSYIPEIAPRHKRGQWGSMVYVAIFGGSVIAYTLGGLISLVLSDEQIGAWGWRIPFLLGAVAAAIAMYMRRYMQESEAFTEANSDETKAAAAQPAEPAYQPVGAKPRKQHSVTVSILLVIGMIAGITASHYTWSSYVSTYAKSTQGMSTEGTYWVTVIAQIVALICLPLWGALSDKIGRRPVIYIFAVGLFVLQIPMMNLIDSRPWTLLVASTVALIVVSAGGALLASIMSEVFPTNQRTKGIGLAYSLSVAIFGGTAPYIFQYFNGHDMGWMSNVYVMILCVLTLISMRMLPETKGINLRHV